VKTLLLDDAIGLLAAVGVDSSSGYRRYGTSQVDTALLIRRLRELRMPLPDVRAVVEAGDGAAREETLRTHLERMEQELAHTRDVVTSLRELLTPGQPLLDIQYRFVPPFRAYGVRGQVLRDEIGPWCEFAYGRLGEVTAGIRGTSGATYSDEFFTEDEGEVVAFHPVPLDQPPVDGVELVDLPGGYFAIAVHAGHMTDFDRTYAALGSHVAEYCEVAPGPIRELYPIGPGDVPDQADYRTEVCWPIQRIPVLKG
jgi:DNA-binding transcriptional MerR regulator